MENQTNTANQAFEYAIRTGRLSEEEIRANYAGKFMFMGFDRYGKALFKNVVTREYLA